MNHETSRSHGGLYPIGERDMVGLETVTVAMHKHAVEMALRLLGPGDGHELCRPIRIVVCTSPPQVKRLMVDHNLTDLAAQRMEQLADGGAVGLVLREDEHAHGHSPSRLVLNSARRRANR